MAQTFHDHFSGVSKKYAHFRPRYPDALFDYLTSLVPREATVWDCAAGSGQATQDLGKRFAHVIGTDASQEQIASASPQPNVEFRVALAEESGLPSGSAGLVTVAQALHWFNLDRFYTEANRVLSSGGVLAVWAYGINQVEEVSINEMVEDFYENIVGPFWPPERRIVEAGYRTIPFPFEEIQPPPFHLETLWTLEELLGYFSTWSATNRYIESLHGDPVQALRLRLQVVWGDPNESRRVLWPIAIRVGRKRPDT